MNVDCGMDVSLLFCAAAGDDDDDDEPTAETLPYVLQFLQMASGRCYWFIESTVAFLLSCWRPKLA